ncbi:MAG TPA: hypothetical protein DIC51_05670 [Coxiellaceae bacterium]|nr:hypothetical protein [Coxiellaceae bacterium]
MLLIEARTIPKTLIRRKQIISNSQVKLKHCVKCNNRSWLDTLKKRNLNIIIFQHDARSILTNYFRDQNLDKMFCL